MEVKYKQLYSNECSICSIKNLLDLFGINKVDIDFIIEKDGAFI